MRIIDYGVRVLAGSMGLLYLACGLYLLLAASTPLQIPDTLRFMLGGLLVLYGGFRIFRALRKRALPGE